jgi:Ca-activated chloride channel family protein
MRRALACLALLLAAAGTVQAHGLLIPVEKSVPPLAMLNHKVDIQIDEQVTVTTVEQTFRNHTSRPLEATYVFPVPRGASVNKFTMWVDGKETAGELVEAKKAREIYNGIVRRTQDPGLLEYLGNDLLQMKVFPVPANGDQKVKLSYTAVANREEGVVEYIYPLKTDGKATATLEAFSISAVIKSQHGITNVYSPTHALTVKRVSDKEVVVNFDRNQGLLDKDFQLFFDLGDKDVGLTALGHRPISSEPGYFTLLVSPKVEMPKGYQVPRDVVMVLDTSGSMRGVKMEQARNALKYCLKNLDAKDRFALIHFATTVNRYRDDLLEVNPEQLGRATKWVEGLQATGGTAINDALLSALAYRSKDEGRSFTVIFFTDGQPTIGETDVNKIIKNTLDKSTASTRIFTFGVGDDVNATMLDKLAEDTHAVSTYVRPAEDIEAKVSGLYAKISNPVLTNLKLAATNGITFSEVYPTRLPDLFYGGQLIVMGRYTGKGPAAIKLTGMVGMEEKEFVYEYTFADKTDDKREFVEHLWARRKVGYLLDQIRANGEKKELVDEVTSLAKRYGITTPYTSWLIVPDSAVPVVQRQPGRGGDLRERPMNAPAPALVQGGPGAEAKPITVEEFARQNQSKPGELSANRGAYAERELKDDSKTSGSGSGGGFGNTTSAAKKEAQDRFYAYRDAAEALKRKDQDGVQAGKLGVDLSINVQNLRNQSRLEQTALRNVQGRNCVEIGGVWIDEGYDAKMKTVAVKAQSNAYFKILEKQPQVRDVFRLVHHLVWITPSGTALIIDCNSGKDELDDKEIDMLFVKK